MRYKYIDLAARTSFIWIAMLIVIIRVMFGLDLLWTLP
jgi:hypothetical protein